MTSHLIWWAFFFAWTVANCSAEGSIENNGLLLSSKIEIKQGPAELVGELTHHGALFGRNFFGETVEKKMYYTKRSLCNSQIPDTPDYIKQDGYFLLVDRGECSFVEKVRNAQRDGATAVFIADNRCLCSTNGLCEQDIDEECEKIEPVMDDDGSGSDIRIPSMLLLKSDADKLRDEIVSGSVVETSISFPVPKAINGRTEYLLFTAPDDHLSHQFLDSFLEAALSFGTKAVFQPRMLLTDGTGKGCRQYDESHIPCKGYCTNYGRYCESPLINNQERYEDKGTKMIVESMRRTCIWNIYGKVDGVGKEWWAYVQLWTLQCSFSQYSTSCAESVYDIAGVDKEEVETCMENSGNFREDVLNTLMETSLSDIAKYKVRYGPTLVVNGAIINGALNFGNSMKAICSTFEDLERPEICGKWDICSNACSKDESCILWGDNQDCSEYRSPYLGNDLKEFDDDYLTFEIVDETTIRPEPSNMYVIPSKDMATKSPINGASNFMEDQTDIPFGAKSGSPLDLNSNRPTVQEMKIANPPKNNSPTDTNEVEDEELNYSQDGQHEFLETIQIYEGSNSDLAIGLGIGFGCAFLLVIIWLLISRERERERKVEDLIASGRIPVRIKHSGLFKSRQRHYTNYSNQSTTSKEIDDQISDDDQFSDEEDYYDDGREVINHHDLRNSRSRRRERDRLFRKNSKRKLKVSRFRDMSSLESSSKFDDQEISHINGRVSIIREKINDKKFSRDCDDDNAHNPRKLLGSIDDDDGDDSSNM